jgi:hypothetical protein
MKYNIGDSVVVRDGRARMYKATITDTWPDDKIPGDDAVVEIEHESLFGIKVKELVHVICIEALKPRVKKG